MNTVHNDWIEHTVWWHAYPLGFAGAPIREPDSPGEHHRLQRLVGWLDHLVELGANGLLLGPVFSSATHGYDTLDHLTIDPRLGDDSDLDALLAEAHRRGVRVALDGVFNHVSDRHPFVLQALAEGPGSQYADWFRIDWEAAGGPRPAVFEGHSSLVALDHANPAVADYVVSVLDHWSGRGVDAWRLDAAYAVEPVFWASVLPRARQAHPGSWFLGEVIHGDYAAIVAESTLDSVTQYELWKAIWSSLSTRNLWELDWALKRHDGFLETFVPATFVGNHDVTRIATQVGPEAAAVAVAVLMTVGGVPTVYAGDELGMTGTKEERIGGDDAVRPEFPEHPEPAAGAETLRLYQDLIGLRRRHPWLVTARTENVELANERSVYRSVSADGAESITVEIDLRGRPQARILAADGSELLAVG